MNQTTGGARRPDWLEGIGCRPPFLICLQGTSSPLLPMHSTDAGIVCHPGFLHVKIQCGPLNGAHRRTPIRHTHECETPIQEPGPRCLRERAAIPRFRAAVICSSALTLRRRNAASKTRTMFAEGHIDQDRRWILWRSFVLAESERLRGGRRPHLRFALNNFPRWPEPRSVLLAQLPTIWSAS
jgi:hypothetical protein